MASIACQANPFSITAPTTVLSGERIGTGLLIFPFFLLYIILFFISSFS